jgi:hypothetical protein
MKLTQRELVYQYILLHGSFTPAKERHATMNGKLLGDSADRRCRELRAEGRVSSEGEGRFERFFIPNFQHLPRPNRMDTATRKVVIDNMSQIIDKNNKLLEGTMKVSLQEMIAKREELRRQYKSAKTDSDRRIIEIRGKALTNAIEQAEHEQSIRENLL